MRRETVLKTLKDQEHELRSRFGVRSLEIFGSVARDEATETSDVDLLVEFDRRVGYFDLFALEDHLEALLGGIHVDLVLRHAVIEDLQPIIYGEAIHVV